MFWVEYICRIFLGLYFVLEFENIQNFFYFEIFNVWNFNLNFLLLYMGFQSQMCLFLLFNIYRIGVVFYKVMSYNVYFQNNVLCSWIFSRQFFWFSIVTFIDKFCFCDFIYFFRYYLLIFVEVVFIIYIFDGQVVGGDGCFRENQFIGIIWDYYYWEIGQKGEEIKGMKLLIV